MSKDSFYITTPIYYVNDKPHLGHAYTNIVCDVMARFQRIDGKDTYFLTGTDDHGQKVAEAAAKAGTDPQSFTDKVSQNFRDLIPVLNFSNDDFIRTTEERHIKSAQALWQKLEEAGDIYLDSYSGWYAVRDEAYYTEDEVEKRDDGTVVAPTGAECEWMEEESYFFRLSAWQDRLLEFYEKNPGFIEPEARRNEILSFVKGGLKDLSISRTKFDWGVPVPGNDKHVMYVWIDALTNYITALGYPDTECEKFKKFWPADVHVVGKDIIRFHAVYWPAFLMSAGVAPPRKVFAHGWWTIEGQKMSKSLGNVISPYDLVERYGVDASRYFVLRAIPFGNDGNFSHLQAVQTINADLANGIGNLSQRTLSMIYKNCEGQMPARKDLNAEDQALLDQAYGLPDTVRNHFNAYEFHKGLEAIMVVARAADGYVDAQAPWTLKKEDPARMAVVLAVLAEVIRCLAIAMQPVTPEAAGKILDQLEVPESERLLAHLNADHALKPGTKIEKPEGVFPRIIEEEAA